MAAHKRITPDLAQAIDLLLAKGISQKSALLRALEANGDRLNWRTLAAYLTTRPPVKVQTPRLSALRAEQEPQALAAPPSAPPATLEASAALALADDDLGALIAITSAVRIALGQWADRIGYEPAAARTYATLANLLGGLTARLVELRPRPEVELDRLEALGLTARAALLERARAVALADHDLRGRITRQQAVIDALVEAEAAQ